VPGGLSGPIFGTGSVSVATSAAATLAAAVRGLAAIAAGNTLTHRDIRADNILVRADGGNVFVDWPWGCVRPAWLDTVLLAVNVTVHGGDGARLSRASPAALDGRDRRAHRVLSARRPAPPAARHPDRPGVPACPGRRADPWLRDRRTI
jgi:Phosphotransferase enzyme family